MKRMVISTVVLFFAAAGLHPAVSAQTIVGSSVVPATGVVQTTGNVPASGGSYYCAKCGTYHASPNPGIGMPIQQTGYQPTGYSSIPNGSMPSTGSLRGSGGVQNVLSTLNAQRARQGVGPLRPDPVLQAVAQRRAQMMASMSLKSHPPGSYAPGTYEGVGWSSSYSPTGVSACFTSDNRMQVAGAAMATGSDGVYFAVVYR